VRRRAGRLAGGALLPAALWLVLGVGGLAVGLAIVAADLLWAPAPRRLLAAAAALVAALPPVVLVAGLPDSAGIGPQLAAAHRWTDLLVGAALALLVLATVRDLGAPATGRGGPPS
jgi:hypothetical protein